MIVSTVIGIAAINVRCANRRHGGFPNVVSVGGTDREYVQSFSRSNKRIGMDQRISEIESLHILTSPHRFLNGGRSEKALRAIGSLLVGGNPDKQY